MMKTTPFRWLILLGTAFWLAGCASPDVNPPVPKPHLGYVDFYAVNADGLSWQVTDMAKPKVVFSDIDPLPCRILRLGLKPGTYALRATILNHVIMQPADVTVEVTEGNITPVAVTLVENGEAQVRERSSQVRGTYYGRYGRGTRITDTAALMFRLEGEVQPSIAYQPKEKMPYAALPEPEAPAAMP